MMMGDKSDLPEMLHFQQVVTEFSMELSTD